MYKCLIIFFLFFLNIPIMSSQLLHLLFCTVYYKTIITFDDSSNGCFLLDLVIYTFLFCGIPGWIFIFSIVGIIAHIKEIVKNRYYSLSLKSFLINGVLVILELIATLISRKNSDAFYIFL